jgi:hypothetical protein
MITVTAFMATGFMGSHPSADLGTGNSGISLSADFRSCCPAGGEAA